MQPVDQLNVEYFYRLLYDFLTGSHTVDTASAHAFLTTLWLWIIGVGYGAAILGLALIVFCLVRLFELREREEKFYEQIILAPDAAGGMNPRWVHIESLMQGGTAAEWREAIIEADIMLDDMLTKQGYTGANIAEKLKSVDPADFNTLQDAWEAHKVRNQIAHEGSSFALSDVLARRTLARFEAVFREFDAL
jgi:hypothetical protein